MKLHIYQENSCRTTPFRGRPQNSHELKTVLDEYAKGLVGEWFELSLALQYHMHKEQLLEAGDVLHYTVGILAALGEEVNEESILNIQVTPRALTEALCDILELVKKHVHHDHELKKHALRGAAYIILKQLVDMFGTETMHIIADMNIEKVKARYPYGVTSEASIARVDVNTYEQRDK